MEEGYVLGTIVSFFGTQLLTQVYLLRTENMSVHQGKEPGKFAQLVLLFQVT